MVDLVCSASLVVLLGVLGLAYALRAARSGWATFDRVSRDQGSALLGVSVMQMGYWGLVPIGRALARFGVTANGITAGALVTGVGAGIGLAVGHWGVAAALAVVSSLCDALDGMVARETGAASLSGEVFDATVDRYVEFAFLAGLALRVRDDPRWLTATLGAILGSFMVSYATAKGEAMRVEMPRGFMRRAERAAYLTMGAALCPFAAAAVSHGGPGWLLGLPLFAAVALVALVSNASAVSRLIAVARATRMVGYARRAGGDGEGDGARSFMLSDAGARARRALDG